ncbi:MAG: PHP domain-containing protein [Synergistaceae bacterium]|nr:PHP domain-containing protein [Synergistaceae bacterium]
MLIDIHIHTEEFSLDSQFPLRRVLSSAVEIGLAGVCITDHESLALYSEAEALSKESGLVVIIGKEYSCQEGHLLVFGALDYIKPGLPLESALKKIKSQGGIAIAAHPFRWDSLQMGEAIKKCAPELDGVEAFNGGATAEENLLAYEFAVENGLPVLGGSDAHHETRIGRFATEFSTPIQSEADFIRAIAKAKNSKRKLESINVSTRQGTSFVSAYPHQKRLHERVSPPPVHSIKDVLSAPRNRFSVEE